MNNLKEKNVKLQEMNKCKKKDNAQLHKIQYIMIKSKILQNLFSQANKSSQKMTIFKFFSKCHQDFLEIVRRV